MLREALFERGYALLDTSQAFDASRKTSDVALQFTNGSTVPLDLSAVPLDLGAVPFDFGAVLLESGPDVANGHCEVGVALPCLVLQAFDTLLEQYSIHLDCFYRRVVLGADLFENDLPGWF